MREHYLVHRKTIGILCSLLAPLSILFGLPFFADNAAINPGWWHSISETYYATSKIIMIGMLVAAGLFEITYKGYDWRDRLVNCITGATCLGVAIFPCKITAYERTGLFNLPMNVSNIFHFVSAGILFVSFAVNILWLFRQTDGVMTEQKKKRNLVYTICGYVIVACCLGLLITGMGILPNFFTIIFEWIALTAFGVAFVVKGEGFLSLNDKVSQD